MIEGIPTPSFTRSTLVNVRDTLSRLAGDWIFLRLTDVHQLVVELWEVSRHLRLFVLEQSWVAAVIFHKLQVG
jgi:hypothetical protein